MRDKVLLPLGMTDSTFAIRKASRRAATSHDQDVRGSVHALPWSMEELVVPLRPSGGLLSHVGGMAKYLQAELAKGKSVTSVQVASEANVVRRRTPKMKTLRGPRRIRQAGAPSGVPAARLHVSALRVGSPPPACAGAKAHRG